MATEFRPVAPVDPTNVRPVLFLDVAREMMRCGMRTGSGNETLARRGRR